MSSNLKKVIITGANGQLGIALSKQFKYKTGFDLSLCSKTDLNIVDKESVDKLFNRINPNILINCAAYTNVEACEDDVTMALEVHEKGTKNLVEACNNHHTLFIHYSTDYVFDGMKSSPYIESDETNPLNEYGRTKKISENLVINNSRKYILIRTAWLYGQGHNFVQTMIKLYSKSIIPNVVDDQYGCPTSCEELAKATLHLLEHDASGLYHCVCNGVCSWYEFASEIYRLLGDSLNVKATTTEVYGHKAKRPPYSVLDTSKYTLTTGQTLPDWKSALAQYIHNQS